MEKIMVSKMKVRRVGKDLTQIDLWMKTGIPQWRLSLIERGIPPRLEEAQKVAEALGCQIEDIFPPRNECIHGVAG